MEKPALPADLFAQTQLVTQGIKLNYGTELRFKFPDIQLYAAQEALVIGPSGSGKSSLLHILAALLRPSEGQFTLSGEDVLALSGSRLERFRSRQIGIVFQDFHLLENYTALENLMLALAATGLSLAEAKQRAMENLKQVQLEHRFKQLAKKLSTGERQRLAIARAVVSQPSLLLADEPTANLDRSRAETALTVLREAAASSGASLLIATHDPWVMQQIKTHISLEP